MSDVTDTNGKPAATGVGAVIGGAAGGVAGVLPRAPQWVG